jgi:hypothetical protein
MLLEATCCALAVLAPAPIATPHPGWEPLIESARPALEVDRRRIVRDRGFVEVWVRTRAERESVAAEFEAAGAPPDRIERVRQALHHSEHLWSFHCEAGTHALGYSAYYERDGALIQDFRVERRAYWPVQADTVGRRLQAVACGGRPDDAHASTDGDGDDDSGEAAADATR